MVRTNIADLLLTCSDGNIWWKFLFGSYIPRPRLESVIPKHSIHSSNDWLLHILLKTLDSSALKPCRCTTPSKEDYAKRCNSRLSNRDGDKEAKLMVCTLNKYKLHLLFIFYFIQCNQRCLHSCLLNINNADFVVCIQRILGEYGGKWRKTVTRGEDVIIVFFVHKKYSCSFVKLRLNHWCLMDYLTDVLARFLDRGTLQVHCCLRRVRELSDMIKNILICVPKINKGLTGLERHEGE